MEKSNFNKVREFHEVFGLSVRDSFDSDNPYNGDYPLRIKLIREEYEELMEAFEEGNYENIAKEMADLLYVVYGTGVTMGIDLDKALDIVHDSNMSKLDDDGKPIYNSYGKVQKSDNYYPANLSELLDGTRKDNRTTSETGE